MSHAAPLLSSYRALADLLKNERPAARPMLVCIDGPGGSGKSTLAKGLAEVFFCLALAPFYDFSIWVECPRDMRLARGIGRDGEVARNRWEQDWMLGEDAYIQSESPRDRAALVCDGSQQDGSQQDGSQQDGSQQDGSRVIVLRGHSARWIK